MSKARVRVAIGEALVTVGVLDFEARADNQISAFHYVDEWLSRPDAFAIAPSVPLTTQSVYASAPWSDPRPALPGVLSDCAPDGWGRRIVSLDLGSPPTELEYLLAANDATRQGALRFLDERGVPLATGMPPVPRLARLPDIRALASAFETNKGDVRALAHQLRGPGSSLGGTRPKSDFEDQHGDLHIAKYTTEKDTLPVERMEAAVLTLAGEVGLRGSSVELALTATPYPVALIKRFDRVGGRRVHYVSARTFLGFADNESAYYTDLADAMRANCGSGADLRNELRELLRRIMFSILVSNDDDHLKNHGFLYAGDGAWRLSPAFDINPNPDGTMHLQTGISQRSGYEASIEAVIVAAPLFDVDEDEAWIDARRMAQTIAARWRPLCRSMGMDRDECDRYAPAFSNAEVVASAAGNRQVRGSRG